MSKDNEKKYGKEYLAALNLILKVREDRRNIYGESWQDMSTQECYFHLKNKFERLTILKENKKINNYENIQDTLIDLANYTLFMLAILQKQKKKY